MNHCVIPDNEAERLASLHSYQILDTPADGAFDRVTALVSRLLDVPVAIVSLVDKDRIWFKSHHGLEVPQIDREPGLCASACLGQAIYVVNDAAVDPRTLSNPLVASSFGLRFYAAAPLRTRSGHGLGTLCCLDYKPREFSERDAELLNTLASLVMDQMELRLAARKVDELNRSLVELHEQLRQQATHDSLTGLWNRGAILELLDQSNARAQRHGQATCVMMLDVDHFKHVNDVHGHPAGDTVLKEVARRLKASLRTSDAIGRVGGEEFLCVLDHCDVAFARLVAERCCEAVRGAPIEVGSGQLLNISVSIGLAAVSAPVASSGEAAVHLADAALYQAKQRGRDRVVLATTEPVTSAEAMAVKAEPPPEVATSA